MPAPKTEAVALLNRRQQIADLYCRGWTQVRIAEHFSLGQATVSRDIAAVIAHWAKEQAAWITEAKTVTLAKIDRLELQAWEAWERSCRPSEKSVAKKRTTPDGDTSEAVRETENRDGNPRFLDVVNRCIQNRKDVLGIDAPKRVDGTLAAAVIVKVVAGIDLERL